MSISDAPEVCVYKTNTGVLEATEIGECPGGCALNGVCSDDVAFCDEWTPADNSAENFALIAGATIGGATALGLAVFLYIYCCKGKKDDEYQRA